MRLILCLQKRSCRLTKQHIDKWKSILTQLCLLEWQRRTSSSRIEEVNVLWMTVWAGIWVVVIRASFSLKKCNCKQLPRIPMKHSDAGDWTAPWRSKCGLAAWWSYTPFWVQCLCVFVWEISDVDWLSWISWVAIRYLDLTPCDFCLGDIIGDSV